MKRFFWHLIHNWEYGFCKGCGNPLTDEDLEYDGGRENFCRDCN